MLLFSFEIPFSNPILLLPIISQMGNEYNDTFSLLIISYFLVKLENPKPRVLIKKAIISCVLALKAGKTDIPYYQRAVPADPTNVVALTE